MTESERGFVNNKAVILGSNFYTGLSIIRGLGANGIPTVAMDYSRKNTYGAKSKYLSEQLIVPHYRERPEELLRFLIEYAGKQDAKPVLFPSVDPYAEFIDANLDVLRQHYLIPMTEQGLWRAVMDKDRLYSLAAKHGVLVPESLRPTEPDFEQRAVAEIGFPCIVKPTDSPAFVSAFRVKNFTCHNLDELKAALVKSAQARLDVVVQRVIPGFDDHVYTFDAYLDQNSRVTHWVTCQKQRQFPIHFGASSFTKQKHVEELYRIGAPFLESIGFKGFAEIEFKKDAESGKYYMLEINARTTTLDPLLRKCGVNFPLLAYRELTGQAIGSHAVSSDTGIAFCFLFEDLIASRDYVKAGELSVLQIVRSYWGKKAPAIWQWDDPAPALYFMYMIAHKAMRKLTRR